MQETGTDQPTDSSCFSAAPLTRPPLITKKIADTICQAACARRPWLMTRGGIPPDSGGCGHPACLQSNGGGVLPPALPAFPGGTFRVPRLTLSLLPGFDARLKETALGPLLAEQREGAAFRKGPRGEVAIL